MPLWFPTLSTVVTAAPGTGSTSLMTACRRSPDVVDLVETFASNDTDLDAKHATVRDLVSETSFEWGDGVGGEIVTTTRNPYDFHLADWSRTRTRWAAELGDPDSWVHRVDGMRRSIALAVENDFADWIELVLGEDFEAGIEKRVNGGHVDEATVVARMEHLGDDIRRLHPRLADQIGTIPHVNRTDRSRDTAGAYTRRAAQLVATVHRRDIERFGYAL